MARKRLTGTQKFRKATVAAHRADQKKIAAEKLAKENRDALEKWRALRRLGVYETKAAPSLKRINKKRRAEINKKFEKVQSLGSYEQGEVYRPLHKHDYQRAVVKRDAMGRVIKTDFRKYSRYDLDKAHFQNVKGEAKKLPGGSLRTEEGFIAPKQPNEKIRITKDGKVQTVETKGGAITRFTREPLSGPLEFITFANDVKSGRLKFGKRQGIAVWSNGIRRPYIGQAAVNYFVNKMMRYREHMITGHGQTGSFKQWANNSEIAFITD
jgi:hypothetical protein